MILNYVISFMIMDRKFGPYKRMNYNYKIKKCFESL